MDIDEFRKLSDSELIDLAKTQAAAIRETLPKQIYAGSLTLGSKLPYKATVFRELMLHRFSDVVDSAINLFERHETIPAFILTRASMENTAIIYWLSVKANEFLDTKDEDAFDEFLMKGMFGGRQAEAPQRAYNVLTAVDQLDKTIKGTRAIYDGLCEYAHPNYPGVMGSYSRVDEKEFATYLGREHSDVSNGLGLVPLVLTLEVFVIFYNSAGHSLQAINDYYEDLRKKKS